MSMSIDELHPAERLTPEERRTIGDNLAGLAQSGKLRTGRRRRIIITAAVAGVIAASGGTAAAVLGGSQPVTNQQSARCYEEISKNFSDDFPGTTVGAPQASGDETKGPIAPFDQCAEAWRVGLLGGHASDQTARTYPVPHLVGCVLPDGTAAVFPGPDGTCASLNLATAQPGTG